MTRGVWVWFVILGACGEDRGSIHDAAGDGAVDGPSASGCVNPGYGDSFDEATPCQAFGIKSGTGMAATANGTLTLTLMPGGSQAVACARQAAAFGPAGAFVEVSRVIGVGQTYLAIQSSAATTIVIESAGMIAFMDGVTNHVTQIPYDPSAHRWWRVRPVGSGVVGELSANGRTWIQFASAAITIDSTVGIAAGIMASSPEVPNNTATFEGIDVCPP